MKRWHFILLAIAACAMSFSYGHSVQPDLQPVVQKVYVPVCSALPFKAAIMVKMSELRP